MEPPTPRKARRLGCWALALATFGLGAYFIGPVVAVALDFLRAGFFQKSEQVTYTGDSSNNLKAIHRALLLYADSEGALPPADRWMDEAWMRLQTRDLPQEEAKKKLRAPGSGVNEWGYGFNAALAGKHPEDIADKSIPMVFESKNKAWNASATEPPTAGLRVTVGGEVVGP